MKRTRLVSSFLSLLLCSPSWAVAGTKEEIIRLQSDVLQLQNQIRLLQKNADESSAILKSLLEQLNDQIGETNVRMETLTGAIQAQKADLATSLSQFRQEIQSLVIKWDDTNTRIAAVQQKLQQNQLQIQSLRYVPSAVGDNPIEPDQVYSSVYNDYLMGNYDLAIAGFQDFLSNYPDNEYSDNASYYLGVCYQEKGRHEQAIQAFDQVINLYPKADKTPPAYYKKALALGQLQKNMEAIETLKKLATIFPDSQEATLARQELEKLGVDVTALKTRQ
ncbi:MAG: tol-pal system protein YbgF [Acidobacteriota bacterium]